MEKQIHINSYVKKDGTKVKEHFRNINVSGIAGGENSTDRYTLEERGADIYNDNVPVLEGSVIYDEAPSLPEGGSVWSEIAKVAAGIGASAVNVAAKICEAAQNSNFQTVSTLKPQLNTAINNIKTTQKHFENLTQKYLDKLVTTKDQTEYKNLLNSYMKQKTINENLNNSIAKIDYAIEHNNYQTLYDELQNYKSNFDEVMKKTRKNRPLKNGNYKNTPAPVPTPHMNIDGLDLDFTKANYNKSMLDVGTFFYNLYYNTPDTAEFWKASSSDFKSSKKYVEKNGNLVYSVSDLPSKNLQNIVSEKLQQQIGTNDALGVIFKPNSSISQLISQSDEIQQFFQKNAAQLLKGQAIMKDSTHFISNKNLHNALGHTDIIYSYIDQKGNLYSIVMDTYDFNPDDLQAIVQMARSAQEANIIRNYYTLSIIITPWQTWQEWWKNVFQSLKENSI